MVYMRTDGRVVNPIQSTLGGDQATDKRDLGPGASLEGKQLYRADLFNANLPGANLSGTTFSASTIFPDGQTVPQHGFDAAGLQDYLEAFPVLASWIQR